MANSIQEIYSKSKSKSDNQSMSSSLKSYGQLTCNNPDQLSYSKKRARQSMKENLMNIDKTKFDKRKELKTASEAKGATAYVSEYISTTSDSTVAELDLESLYQKMNNNQSDLEKFDNEKCSVYLQLLFPSKTIDKQQATSASGSTSPSSITNSTSANDKSLYQVGCKVLSISKIS